MKLRDHFETLTKKPRIKLKMFGSSMSGKTALSASLRSGVVTGYLKRKMKAISHIGEWLNEGGKKFDSIASSYVIRRSFSFFTHAIFLWQEPTQGISVPPKGKSIYFTRNTNSIPEELILKVCLMKYDESFDSHLF